MDISIHALLAESDGPMKKGQVYYIKFLSTLSLRRATLGNVAVELPTWNFYPRSPCGERPRYGRPSVVQLVFLSTLSLRRATHAYQLVLWVLRISIHALLAESDYFD